jgi:hypothetical protein
MVVGVVGTLWAVEDLMDFDLSTHDVREISFTVEDAVLSGTLVLPHNCENPPIALTIHGDGPQDRFSNVDALRSD